MDEALEYLASMVFPVSTLSNGWMLVGRVNHGTGRPDAQVVVQNIAGESTPVLLVGIDVHSLNADGDANIMVQLDQMIASNTPVRVHNVDVLDGS